MSAYHSFLDAPSAFSRIDIHIYDDIEPTIIMNDHISISYKKTFNINDYLTYSDNATSPCSIIVLGEYNDKIIDDC